MDAEDVGARDVPPVDDGERASDCDPFDCPLYSPHETAVGEGEHDWAPLRPCTP